VIDNEAGLEHLSRRTTRDVDVLLIVSDATVRGLTTAGRVVELIGELRTKVGRHYLIVNRAPGSLTPELEGVIARYGLELLAALPEDGQIAEFDAVGDPLVDLPETSAVAAGVEEIADIILSLPTVKETLGAHHR
jgi:CO dehydrogenase maturation factor